MSHVTDAANLINSELNKVGTSQLKFATSLFTGKQSDKPDLRASIKGKEFRVIMFDASEADGIPSASAHFTMDLAKERIEPPHMAYWNAENRFTKMYFHADQSFLVMDQFISPSDIDAARSSAAIWAPAVAELSRFKSVYERVVGI